MGDSLSYLDNLLLVHKRKRFRRVDRFITSILQFGKFLLEAIKIFFQPLKWIVRHRSEYCFKKWREKHRARPKMLSGIFLISITQLVD